MTSDKITISVHERADNQPGYIVKLVVVEDGKERVAKFPCDGEGDSAYNEAVLLMESIKGLAETGSVDALLPEDDE